MSDYECDFGGMPPSPPPHGGHSGAWVAAVVSATIGSVALVVAVLVVTVSCIKLRRRGAEPDDKGLAGASDGPGEDYGGTGICEMVEALPAEPLFFIGGAGLHDAAARRVSADTCCMPTSGTLLTSPRWPRYQACIAPLTGGGLWLPAPPPDWSDARASASAPSASRTARWPVLRQLRDASSAQPARSATCRRAPVTMARRSSTTGWCRAHKAIATADISTEPCCMQHGVNPEQTFPEVPPAAQVGGQARLAVEAAAAPTQRGLAHRSRRDHHLQAARR